MKIIPFPKSRSPSRRAVADFKKVSDDFSLVLREYEVEAFLDRIQAQFGGKPPPKKPQEDV